MAIAIELPDDIERDLRNRIANLDQTATEAFLVELYRQRKLSHNQLARALNLTRNQTDGLLKRHNVLDETTLEDVLQDASRSRDSRSS